MKINISLNKAVYKYCKNFWQIYASPYINTARIFGKFTHLFETLYAFFISNTFLNHNWEKCNN